MRRPTPACPRRGRPALLTLPPPYAGASARSEIKERVKKAKEEKAKTKKASETAKPKASVPKAGGAPKGGKAGGKR